MKLIECDQKRWISKEYRAGLAMRYGLVLQRYEPLDDARFYKLKESGEALVVRVDLHGNPSYVEKYSPAGKARAAYDFDRIVSLSMADGFPEVKYFHSGRKRGLVVYDHLEALKDEEKASKAIASDVVKIVSRLNSLKVTDVSTCRRYNTKKNRNYMHRFSNIRENIVRIKSNIGSSSSTHQDSFNWFERHLASIKKQILVMPKRPAHGDAHIGNCMRDKGSIKLIDPDEWGILPLGVDMSRVIFPYFLNEHGFDASNDLIIQYHSMLQDPILLDDLMLSVWAHVIIINASDIAEEGYGHRSEFSFLLAEVVEMFRATFGQRVFSDPAASYVQPTFSFAACKKFIKWSSEKIIAILERYF